MIVQPGCDKLQFGYLFCIEFSMIRLGVNCKPDFIDLVFVVAVDFFFFRSIY